MYPWFFVFLVFEWGPNHSPKCGFAQQGSTQRSNQEAPSGVGPHQAKHAIIIPVPIDPRTSAPPNCGLQLCACLQLSAWALLSAAHQRRFHNTKMCGSCSSGMHGRFDCLHLIVPEAKFIVPHVVSNLDISVTLGCRLFSEVRSYQRPLS